jgi:hypothetical protein
MNVSFTQTYGNERKHLLYYQMNDDKIVKFKNMFDLNIFSFHNCDNSVIDYFWSINKIKNVKVLRFNDIEYTHCIFELFKILESINTNLFFFIQDDALSFNEINYEELLRTYKNDMFISFDIGLKHMLVEYRKKDGMFYEFWSEDFLNSDLWTYNDSPYLTTFKRIKEIYDRKFFLMNNVWQAEKYLHLKYSEINLIRYILQDDSFKNVNTLGPTSKFLMSTGIELKNLVAAREAENIINKRYMITPFIKTNVEVVNLKEHVPTEYDYYIGRPSPLGNPYTHLKTSKTAEFNVSTRDESIKFYRPYFYDKIESNDKEFIDAINEILTIYKKYGQVNLCCWCKPKSCHGDCIKEYIEKILINSF